MITPFRVQTDEPIPARAFPWLDLGPSMRTRPFVPENGDGEWASQFVLEGAALLPPAMGAHIRSSSFVDLRGNGGTLDVSVDFTWPYTADGYSFDVTPFALGVEGNARIVTGLGSLPPIAGAGSLFVGASVEDTPGGTLHGGRVVLRLLVAPGDTVVRAEVRLLGFDVTGTIFDGRVSALAPDGTESLPASALVTLAGPLSTETGDTAYPSASDVFTLEIPLPAGVTDQVVVVLSTLTGPCGHPPPPSAPRGRACGGSCR